MSESPLDHRTNASWMFRPVPIDWLVVYRLAFGGVMSWYAWTFIQTGAVNQFYEIPLFHFSYDGFRWVQLIDLPFQIDGEVYQFISLEYVCLLITGLMIMAGLFYRLAATVFAICFTHVFLIDKCYYQNHYYLVSLLALQLPFLPANRAFSIDALLFPSKASSFVPAWTLWLIRFQIGVPYFFGGIAKLNADWLRGQPVRMSMADKIDMPFVGGLWLTEEWCVQCIVWGGLLFDLLVVPGLLWKRTRMLSYGCALAFHLTNSQMWTIGIFPWLMILATTVYFEPDWPRRALSRVTRQSHTAVTPQQWIAPGHWRQVSIAAVLTLFVTWQCLMPFRHLVTTGNPNWDEYSHYFSWHMLLRAKECGLRVYATDPATTRSGVVDLRSYLTARQLSVVARDPRMIHQLCRYVAQDLSGKGFPDVEIRALALVSLNGRKAQLLIDPTVNLAAVPVENVYPSYIVPLHEPYRHDAWDFPLAEWEQHLDLELPPQMHLSQTSNTPRAIASSGRPNRP
ncbi:MAG: HTTM domain-containing protein [Planctomycetaceae bacterium]|nr:HTTM domain-containing protein [Planctomycetaceae bacterium]